MNSTNKPGLLFWLIAVIGLLWNLMGLYQFYLGTAGIDTLKEMVTADEFAVMQTAPSWYTTVFGIAVVTGFLGAVTLLLKMKLSVVLFGLSLLAVLVTEAYWLLGTNIIEVVGTSAVAMPFVVVFASVFYFFYSRKIAGKGWLT